MSNSSFIDFINFMSNMWGALTSMAVIFPLADKLIKIIPTRYAEGDKIGVPSSVFSLFCVVFIYTLFKSNPGAVSSIYSLAFFVIGVASFISYMYYHSLLHIMHIRHGDYDLFPEYAAKTAKLNFLYILMFSSITASFTFLACIEYFVNNSQK